MKALFTCFVLISILIGGCSGAPAADTVATSVASTLAAQPTNTLMPTSTTIPTSTAIPTSTSVPLSEIDLSSIIIKPGDLPTGYSGAQIRITFSDLFKSAPKPLNYVYQQFENYGKLGGGVDVALYDDNASLISAYENLGFDDKEVSDIGEKAHLSVNDILSLHFVNLKFIRCTAVVNIQVYFYTVNDPDSVISYAQRLDERLTQLVCR